MSTAARIARADVAARPDPVEVFQLRAWARAKLWQAGELTLHDAVDVLQAHAVRDGLVERLGQDEVQRMMAAAFTAVRDDPVPDTPADAMPELDEHTEVANSTLAAAAYLIHQDDAERLRAWLAKHTASERIAVREQLRDKGGR